MDFHRSLEMSLSREEFLHLLPAAVGPFTVDGNTIRPAGAGGGWLIRLVPLSRRLLAGAELPCHRVEITLEGCPEGESDAFMARFHRAFLRGGG